MLGCMNWRTLFAKLNDLVKSVLTILHGLTLLYDFC